jgi:flagellar L-ring protein precursor FlgH
MKRLRFLLLFASMLLIPAYTGADSLWERRDPRAAFLFWDNRARRVGDLVTILVQETTDIGDKDERQMSKDTKAGGTFNFKGNTAAGKLTRSAQVGFDSSGTSDRSFDGKSQLTIGHNFTDRISVTVTDVLPNGNLVLEGYRRRRVSGEERLIRISGIIRPDDITLTNTIPSQFVANFQITYVGKGPESRFTNQNYLGKLFNLLWPF